MVWGEVRMTIGKEGSRYDGKELEQLVAILESFLLPQGFRTQLRERVPGSPACHRSVDAEIPMKS
jgi:hypothetical protein